MWNETVEVTALREALGLYSAHLLAVSPASHHQHDPVRHTSRVRTGLLCVFDYVVIYDCDTDRTIRNPHERDSASAAAGTSGDGLCRWFADSITTAAWNDADEGFTIFVDNSPSFSFCWVDHAEAVFNALRWVFDWHSRRGSRDISPAVLGATLYPQATARLQQILKHADDLHEMHVSHDHSAMLNNSHTTIGASGSSGGEFVVADLDGAILTNKRLFFATSVVALHHVKFMKLDVEHIVIIVSKYTRLRVKCTAFRQSLLLRKWLLSVLENNHIKMLNNHSKLRVMMALHRQFCAVAPASEGDMDRACFAQLVGPIFVSDFFIDGFFRIMDTDNSGTITFAEFAVGLMDMLSQDAQTRVKFTFALCDLNGDGGVDEPEMLRVLQALQQTGDVTMSLTSAELQVVCNHLFELLDVDHDRVITVDEYMEGFCKPEVYTLLARLGLAGDRSMRQRQELLTAIATPSNADWCAISAFMQAMRILADEVHIAARGTNSDLKPAGPPSAVTVHVASKFRALHRLWGMELDALEDGLALDNIAANLLLGSTSLPRLVSRSPIRFVGHDHSFVAVEISATMLSRLLDFLTPYTEHLARYPLSCLARIAGIVTTTAINDGAETHLCLLWHPKGFQPIVATFPSKDARPFYFDSGWGDIIKGQLERDMNLLASHTFDCAVTFRSDANAMKAQLPDFWVPPPRDVTREQQQEPAPASPKKKKPKAGGCCGGGAQVRAEPPREGVAAKRRAAILAAQTAAAAQNLVPHRKSLSPVTASGWEIEVTLHFLASLDPLLTGVEPTIPLDMLPQVEPFVFDRPTNDIPIPPTGQQCVSYPVTVFNGHRGELTLDRSARILYLSANSKSLFSISLRMSFGLGLVRPKYATGLNRKRLLLRADPDVTFEHYRTASVIEFESIEDLERLTSDVFRGTGAGNLSGMQCSTFQIVIVHWNVGGANPPASLADLFPAVTETTQIVIVSANQCVFQSPGRNVTLSCEADWTARVLHELGPKFSLLTVLSCGASRLIVACRAGLQPRISNMNSVKHSIVSEQGRAAGTCVCLSLMIEQTPLCFIGLEQKAGAPPATNALRFEEMLRNISRSLKQPVDVLNSHFSTFIFGDFNFGTTLNNTQAVSCACRGDMKSLQVHDCMQAEYRANGSLFQFEEKAIDFPPTSTFVRNVTSGNGSRIYDEWHRHPPSWGSRIVYKCLGHAIDKASCVKYTSVQSLLTSSHNPVYAVFDLPVRQQYVMTNVVHQPIRCVKLIISDLRCEGLAAEDLNGTSDPRIKFVCPYLSHPDDAVTPVVMGTLNPAWHTPFDLLLEGVESALLSASYLTFIITDIDSRGAGDALGEAVTPLAYDMTKHRRSIEAPVMRNGRKCGVLHCSLRLITA